MASNEMLQRAAPPSLTPRPGVLVLESRQSPRHHATLLQRQGFQAQGCASLADLYRHYDRAPAPLLLLAGSLDDAYMASTRMRALDAGLGIVVAGGFASSDQRVRAMQCGADVCLPAGVDGVELVAALQALMRRAGASALLAAYGWPARPADARPGTAAAWDEGQGALDAAQASGAGGASHAAGAFQPSGALDASGASGASGTANSSGSAGASGGGHAQEEDVGAWPPGGQPPAGAPRSPQDAASASWRLEDSGWTLAGPRGDRLRLTTSERAFMSRLLAAPARRLSRGDLVASLGKAQRPSAGAQDGEPGRVSASLRGVDVMVCRLRRKAHKQGIDLPVRAVYRWGYMFVDEP